MINKRMETLMNALKVDLELRGEGEKRFKL